MIERAQFQNFKSLRDVELPALGRLTLFVGPNASGKTSILEALHYIAQLGQKTPEALFKGPRDPETLWYRGAEHSDDIQIKIAGQWLSTDEQIELSISHAGELRPGQPVEYQFTLLRHDASDENSSTDSALIDRPGMANLAYDLSSALFLRLNPAKLVAPSYSQQESPRVEYDGEGLATVIREMHASQPAQFERLEEFLSNVVPAVEGVRTRRAPVWEEKTREITVDGRTFTRQDVEKVMGEEVIFDMDGARGIPAHATSEGTILTLGLLAVLLNERRPNLLLLDDIEQALHPQAQKRLVAVLKELLKLYPELQIFATSHSPFLLDELDADQIWLTNIDEGQTAVQRLNTHREFDVWRDEMSPGEFWTYVGEHWVTSQNND